MSPVGQKTNGMNPMKHIRFKLKIKTERMPCARYMQNRIKISCILTAADHSRHLSCTRTTKKRLIIHEAPQKISG